MTQPTGRGLIIAEKSSAMLEYKDVYNKHKHELPYTLDFEKFHGHVVQLKMPDEIKAQWIKWDLENLPMIPSEDEWQYKKEKDPKRYDAVLNAIKNGKYDFIINGGDFEREGQLIQDAFFSTMPKELKKIPIYRLWANDMTDAGLFKGLQNLLLPGDNIPNAGTVQDLSSASFIRARFDWLLGLNSSQVISLKSEARVSSGRVKMPILKIIVDRENAINSFVPKPFWTIKIVFEHENGTYEGLLLDEETNKPKQFFNQDEAEKIAESLKGKSGTVSEVNVKKVNERAPKFYSITSLQGDAADIYGITMPRSLAALQSLYEAKILSYPRTDSKSITTEMAKDIEPIILSARQVPQLSDVPDFDNETINAFKKNKTYVNNADARAHTAIMPLENATFNFGKLSDDEQKVLYLAARSLLLAFLPPLVKEKTDISTNVGEYIFKTNGSRVLQNGWTEYVPEYTSKDQLLPIVNENDAVVTNDPEIKEGVTTPPKRYTVRTLMSLLENVHRLLEDDEEKIAMKNAEGLGRPSTRTSILEELQKNEMINTSGKKQEYSATPFGISIIDQIQSSPLVSPSLTARWESKLQEVEAGDLDSDILYQQMVKYTESIVDKLKAMDIEIDNAPAFGNQPVLKLDDGREIKEAKSGFYDQEFLDYMSQREEATKNGSAEPERHGFWLSKKIKSEKMEMKGSFSVKDVRDLLENKIITKHMKWLAKNNESDVKMKWNEKKNNIEFIFEKSNQEKKQFKLGAFSIEEISGTTKDKKPYDFYKINNDDKKVIWAVVMQHKLTHEELEKLLNGDSVQADDFVSKKGSKFSATISLNKEFKIDVKFDSTNKNDGVKVDIPNHDVKLISGISSKTKKPYEFYKVDDHLTVFKTMSGHTITPQDLNTLLTNGSFYATDFVSKKGNNFEATVVLNNDKLEFSFD